jgi:hypothetical protein
MVDTTTQFSTAVQTAVEELAALLRAQPELDLTTPYDDKIDGAAGRLVCSLAWSDYTQVTRLDGAQDAPFIQGGAVHELAFAANDSASLDTVCAKGGLVLLALERINSEG